MATFNLAKLEKEIQELNKNYCDYTLKLYPVNNTLFDDKGRCVLNNKIKLLLDKSNCEDHSNNVNK